MNTPAPLKKIHSYFLEYFSRLCRYPFAKPKGGDIMITSRCNFHCRHCDIWREEDSRELDLDAWKSIIARLRRRVGPGYAISVGGGEPLLRPDIFEILKMLVQKNFKVSLVTNGYLIDREKAEKIVKLNINEIRLSLYSYSPEIHNRLRGMADAHEKVIGAAELLLAESRKQRMETRICAAMLINAETIGREALRLIDWANAKGIFTLVQAVDNNFKIHETSGGQTEAGLRPGGDSLWPKDKNQIKAFFDQLLLKKRSGYKIINSVKTLEAFRVYFLNPRQALSFPCTVGYRSMNLNPQGQIFFCFDTGNIASSLSGRSPEVLWRSEELRQKRALAAGCGKVCRIRCYYRDSLVDKIKKQSIFPGRLN
ncbi:MAG: radical SAM protein [bacterium]|nr:radical SAM protein [bacterium]